MRWKWIVDLISGDAAAQVFVNGQDAGGDVSPIEGLGTEASVETHLLPTFVMGQYLVESFDERG